MCIVILGICGHIHEVHVMPRTEAIELAQGWEPSADFAEVWLVEDGEVDRIYPPIE